MTNEEQLKAMMAQYEESNKPKFEKTEKKEYNLDNYFAIFLEKGVKTGTKEIRVLPSESGSPFQQVYLHVIKVGTEFKKFPCLKHEENSPCPFCEVYDELRSTGVESDKKLAGKYNARLFFIGKVIDRSLEDKGVKFWRFAQSYDKTGIYDKINGIVTSLKKDKFIADPVNGRDLTILISRNANDFPVVSSITHNDSSPLSENAEQAQAWLDDKRTWRDVYSVRTYDYLAVIVNGGEPVWSKEENKWVDKNNAKADEPTTDGGDNSEITMGLETIKTTIEVAAPKKGKKVEVDNASQEEEVEGLPF